MKASFLLVPLLAASLLWTTGCAGKASEAEVAQMCKNLVELRGAKAGDSSEVDLAEEMDKCKADPMIREASKDAAACRIAAKDVDTFWNKCR